MLSLQTKQAIRQAFQSGMLLTEAVDPKTGVVSKYPLRDVLKHQTEDQGAITCTAQDGRQVTTTEDHSLFQMRQELVPIKAKSLKHEDYIVEVQQGAIKEIPVTTEQTKALPVSYDLSVPGPENFVLANGILAHNSYSIGGISLDIERSSKYMDLKRNAEEQWDKMVEAKKMTTLLTRGLRQPRFGVGIRSSFGPAVSRGVLSPRSFL